MRILLTGATGYLGSRLLGLCLAAGHEVAVTLRQGTSRQRIQNSLGNVSIIELIHNRSPILAEYGPFDAVIHTATCYGRNGETLEDLIIANIQIPLSLLCQSNSRGALVFINTDTMVPRTLNAYAFSKGQFAEWGRWKASMEPRLRFVNMQLEHCFGPGDHASKFVSKVLAACINDEVDLALTPGDQERDFIYIDDVVSAFAAVLERVHDLQHGFTSFQVGSGKCTPVKAFVEEIHRVAMSRTILRFGAVNYRDGEPMRLRADTHALEALGWRCKISLKEGIARTVALQRKILGNT